MNAGHISAVGMNVIPSWRSQPLPELLSFPHAVNKLANPSRSTFFFFFKDSESWSKMVSRQEHWGMTQELPTLVLKNVYPISLAHSLFIHHLFVVSIGKKMSWHFNLNPWMLILYLLRKDTFSYLSFSLPLFQFFKPVSVCRKCTSYCGNGICR